MEGEQFSLCWNNFHNNLSNGFHTLLKDEDLVDVTIAVEGQYLKAHRVVLSVCSPYFKDLFKANPSNHPIVILPEITYKAISSLIQYMYLGEVSVSQQDIPMFMRVAELLKVKGLTDNNSEPDSNGFMSNRNIQTYPDQNRTMLKRPRPIRKLSRPMHNPPSLSPINSSQQSPSVVAPQSPSVPNDTSSPLPPPMSSSQHPPTKKSILGDNWQMPPQTPHPTMPSGKPKQEPPDPIDGDNTSHSGGESANNLDSPHIIDSSVGESSALQNLAAWPSTITGSPSSSPVNNLSNQYYQVVRSSRGQWVFIFDGHIYIFYDRKDIRKLWLCAKSRSLNCPGHIVTVCGPAILSYGPHNHPPLHNIISNLHLPKDSLLDLSLVM